MSRSDGNLLPPVTRTGDGDARRLGVELEFSGLDVGDAANILRSELGGSVKVVSAYEHHVCDTTLGDFIVELDFAYLKALGRESGPVDDVELQLDRLPERVLAQISRHVVPLEVVTPPIPMDRIGELDQVVVRLREAGALGTRQSPIYAFGLHLNPEMPALDATTVGAYLRAFLCLYEWLLAVSEVDWSRRVTPYIAAFPGDYVRQVVAPGYTPDMDTLIDDYLALNADRNRALDMLPLFAHIDETRVRGAVDDPRVKARPALHYRLANCDIDLADWGVHTAWGHWLQVERLAHDRDRLESVAAAYHQHLDAFTTRTFGDWAKTCEQWLDDTAR